jgi:hypothetical protein
MNYVSVANTDPLTGHFNKSRSQLRRDDLNSTCIEVHSQTMYGLNAIIRKRFFNCDHNFFILSQKANS